MSLIDYAISRTICLSGKNGQPDQWIFYLLPPGYSDCSQLPTRSTFGVVSSPVTDSRSEMNRCWHYTRWVTEIRIENRYRKRFVQLYRKNPRLVALMPERKHYSKHRSHFYRIDRREGKPLVRLLTEEERTHFEALAGIEKVA